jgi:hypothetical protein
VKTFVDFRSDKFPPYEGEEEDINPGLWGKRLAEYFVENLPSHGLETEEIIAEDWGYYIPIVHAGFRLAICCGHQYGDDNEFLCFTDPRDPIIRKLLKKVDATEALTRLTGAIRNILSADDDIEDIKWYTPKEFENLGA